MTQQERSRKALQKWQRLVSEQARSGQSVAAFCRERELCAPHFYWWKKRLRENAPAKFVEVKLASRSEPAAARATAQESGERRVFRREDAVAEASAGNDARVEIRLRNGRSLVVGPGFETAHLQALLAVVEAA